MKSAQSFVADGPEGIATHFADVRSLGFSRFGPPEGGTPNFHTFHVNGTMPTAHRERLMRGFRAAPHAVMSNARCLTEGVDVPAVDVVAFLSPRRSPVDIVQATGRAMRLTPGKTIGYVLVPLHLEQAACETVEQAVTRANFDDVWDVLQSLQEQDEELAEIIGAMREERGRTKGFDDAPFRERVDILGPRAALETLRKAIATACIDLLADNWEERFGQLRAFEERFGHCVVPNRWGVNPGLGFWVGNQRQRKKTNTLSEDRIRRLEEIGFNWTPYGAQWEEMFAALLKSK